MSNIPFCTALSLTFQLLLSMQLIINQLKESQSNANSLALQVADMTRHIEESNAQRDKEAAAQGKNKAVTAAQANQLPQVPDMSDWSPSVAEFHRRVQEKRARTRLLFDGLCKERQKLGTGPPNNRSKKRQADVKSSSDDDSSQGSQQHCSSKSSTDDEQQNVYTVQDFVKKRTNKKTGIPEIQVRWQGHRKLSWEPEENLRSDLGNEEVDKMLEEMEASQEKQQPQKVSENIIGVLFSLYCMLLHRCPTLMHHTFLPLHQQQTSPSPSLPTTITELCRQQHNKATTFVTETDPKYCRYPYYLHNLSCNSCATAFVCSLTKSADGQDNVKEYKPSLKNPVYRCLGSTRGCKIALCKSCYAQLPSERHRGGAEHHH